MTTAAALPYRLYRYERPDGSFDYEGYVAAQVAANALKLRHSFAQPAIIASLAGAIRRAIPAPRQGICHGTRRGLEQRWFREALPGCDVIGTEIAPTATAFPHTVRWDFHEPRPDWVGVMDFVYSNSLDHAYDPARALTTWMASLQPHGLCCLECSLGHERVTKTDPFYAPMPVLLDLIAAWGDGSYRVREIWPVTSDPIRYVREHRIHHGIRHRQIVILERVEGR